MEATNHKFSELFKQLGLRDDPEGIEQFITSHSPLKDDVKLVDATFWTPAQRKFLEDSINEDSDWAVMFDQLNEALHTKKNNR